MLVMSKDGCMVLGGLNTFSRFLLSLFIALRLEQLCHISAEYQKDGYSAHQNYMNMTYLDKQLPTRCSPSCVSGLKTLLLYTPHSPIARSHVVSVLWTNYIFDM